MISMTAEDEIKYTKFIENLFSLSTKPYDSALIIRESGEVHEYDWEL